MEYESFLDSPTNFLRNRSLYLVYKQSEKRSSCIDDRCYLSPARQANKASCVWNFKSQREKRGDRTGRTRRQKLSHATSSALGAGHEKRVYARGNDARHGSKHAITEQDESLFDNNSCGPGPSDFHQWLRNNPGPTVFFPLDIFLSFFPISCFAPLPVLITICTSAARFSHAPLQIHVDEKYESPRDTDRRFLINNS